MFIKKASLHNYAYDNTLSALTTDINDLIEILTDKSQKTIDWMKLSQIIVNPKKFHAVPVSKKENALPRNLKLQINNAELTPQSSVELLGVTIDNELKLDQHINRLGKTAECQVNALFRLKNYLNYEQKKVLIESFIYANFNFCPLVWHFCTYKSMSKIESMQKRALQLLYNDFESNYSQRLDKTKKSTMTIVRLRCLCLEIYKTIKCLNSAFITYIFKLSDSKKPSRKQSVLSLNVTRPNQVRYDERSLKVLGSKIWNNLPAHIKSVPHPLFFKHLIKSWNGVSCKCNPCKKL